MKTEENIDILIKEALNKEEADFYQNLDEQSMPEMVTGLFKGKLKWFAILTMALTFIWFGAAIFCAIKFFNTEELREMMIYGAGFFLSMMIVTMLKIWNWMQMDKNAIMRELKRMELQIAMLKNHKKNNA